MRPRNGPLRAVFDRAVRPSYRSMRDLVTYLAFERRYGVKTMGVIELEQLGLAGSNRERYKATGWLTLPRILPEREVGADDVFIDFGSGMGRVVFQAAVRYPFKRVIGVELSERLNAIARANIDGNRHRLRSAEVELVTGDALEYEIPDDVTVAFFASPLRGADFTTLIERTIASFDRRPRPLRIVYHCPLEHERIMGTGRLRPTRLLRGIRPTPRWSLENSTRVYAVVPAQAEARPAGGRAS